MSKKPKADRGLFRRRGSPFWWIRYADPNGRIVRVSTGTTEKTLAKKVLAKKKTLVVEGKHLDKKKVPKTTFYQLCDQYWELEGQHKRMKGLSHMLEIWKKAFSNTPVRELNQQKVERFLVDKMTDRKWSSATRNRHLTMLKAMFNKGLGWGLVVDNPAIGIKKLRENGARTRFLDQSEINCLLGSASGDFYAILVTALHSGMRRGEILKLRWSDIDLKNQIITVQESKSGQKRMIPMDTTLHNTLSDLPSRFQKGYVFPSPVNPGKQRFDVLRQWRKVIKISEIDSVRFHDLRHTFASHLIMNGVDIKTVQELLGHSSLTMTMRYTHLAPDHRTRAIKILDTALQTDTITDTAENSGSSQSG